MEDYDGIVGIYSKVNSLSNRLKEKFEQKYLEVKIFDDFNKADLSHLSYLIINLIDFKEQLIEIQNVIKGVECKILVLHPLLVKKNEKFVIDSELSNLININQNLGILLVPEMLGRDVLFNQLNISHDLIMQSILSERIKIRSDSQLINTVSINKLADRIVRDTFSFGISGEIISIVGPRKSKKTFATKYLGIDDSNIVLTNGESETIDLYSMSSVQIDFSLRLAIKNTREYFVSITDVKVEESLLPPEVKKEKVLNNQELKKKVRRFWKLLLIVVFFAFTPFYLIIISLALLVVSLKTTFTNNSLSSQLIVKSMQVADLGRNLSFGNNFIYDTANIVFEVSSLGSEGIILVDAGKQFVNKIMDDSQYDLAYESNNISASLDKIHTNISFLQSDVNELSGFVGNYLRNKLVKRSIDIGEYKTKIYEVKNLFSRISILLGTEKPQKYLILFQNNMELRPTGGFIGSFGLVTFDKGRMSEIVVNDVYMADGQLKGHVDPPEPIRKHLGEGGWYLRDSNWDPNFPISAVKAEWFLEKEIGETVDGVITVDLNFVKRLLAIIGPVNLPDFNLTVDSNNLYTLIQSEVESEFFPGSIKKATILTSLTKSLIEEVETLDGDKYLAFFSELYESLERRHIQIYLHDNNAQEAIQSLGYAGEMDLNTDCGLRCFRDTYALIDANLGVNKSNFFIKRSHELNLSISKEFLGHELLVNYENTASPAIGNMGVYKNYARILLPVNAKIGGVRLYDSTGSYSDLEYDLVDTDGRREVGFLVEVLPGTQKKLQIVWNIEDKKLELGGQYDIKIIKQAGTEADNLVVNVRSSDLTLTGRSLSSYNTDLARDFKARLFFRP
ncbi:MAG: DUF4012 domain-containing protein [Microgenomates group bacterium]